MIDFLFKLDWAINDIKAPSNSLMLVVIEYAKYSTTSFGKSIPSWYIFLFNTAILVSRSGDCKSADNPHLNLDNNLCSIPCNSTGGLSEVNTN